MELCIADGTSITDEPMTLRKVQRHVFCIIVNDNLFCIISFFCTLTHLGFCTLGESVKAPHSKTVLLEEDQLPATLFLDQDLPATLFLEEATVLLVVQVETVLLVEDQPANHPMTVLPATVLLVEDQPANHAMTVLPATMLLVEDQPANHAMTVLPATMLLVEDQPANHAMTVLPATMLLVEDQPANHQADLVNHQPPEAAGQAPPSVFVVFCSLLGEVHSASLLGEVHSASHLSLHGGAVTYH